MVTLTKVKVWKCWQGCVQDHPGLCAHGLFPRKFMQDGIDEGRPYVAFWKSIGGKHWGFPQYDKFAVYSLVDGMYVGTLLKDESRFVSFRGSVVEPEKFGVFHKCLELKEKWVSIASLRNSQMAQEDWENLVSEILQRRLDVKFEEDRHEQVV